MEEACQSRPRPAPAAADGSAGFVIPSKGESRQAPGRRAHPDLRLRVARRDRARAIAGHLARGRDFDAEGRSVASGTYVLRLVTGIGIASRKIALVR